jgi:hypothetical protein
MTPAELEAALNQHVQTVMGNAWNCPPGGNHVWDRTLAWYGVAADPAVERLNEAIGRGMVQGAIPCEVSRVLYAVQAWAQAQLGPHVPASGLISDPGLAALAVRIAQLPVIELQRYEAAVMPRRAPSVGSIFANASATAGQAPWAKANLAPASVLVCIHCGAPQQAALNFTCKYCQKPMAGDART